jgi:hypothetical protein
MLTNNTNDLVAMGVGLFLESALFY